MKPQTLFTVFLLLAGCLFSQVSYADSISTGSSSSGNTYTSITMDEAAEIFQEEGDYVIVDVRTEEEYAGGHIQNAVNIPNEMIQDEENQDRIWEQLPDKKQEIYIYCRSGRRSKQASEKLAALGYIHVIECGGILDWTGAIVTEEEAQQEEKQEEQQEEQQQEEQSDQQQSTQSAVGVTDAQMDILGTWEDEQQIYVLEVTQDEQYHGILYRKTQKVFDSDFSLINVEGTIKLDGYQGEMLNADCNNFNVIDHVNYDAESEQIILSITYQGERSVVNLDNKDIVAPDTEFPLAQETVESAAKDFHWTLNTDNTQSYGKGHVLYELASDEGMRIFATASQAEEKHSLTVFCIVLSTPDKPEFSWDDWETVLRFVETLYSDLSDGELLQILNGTDSAQLDGLQQDTDTPAGYEGLQWKTEMPDGKGNVKVQWTISGASVEHIFPEPVILDWLTEFRVTIEDTGV